MNKFSIGMKLLNYLVSINVGNSILNGPRTNFGRKFFNMKIYNEYTAGSYLMNFMPAYYKNFMVSSVAFSLRTGDRDKLKDKKSRLKSQGSIVSVIDENNAESVMSLVDAEKFAKRKNMALVLVQGGTEKVKYRLEELSHRIEGKKDKGKDKKKIYLKEETQPHDVEIKINQMLRFLDKGLKVSCIIEGPGNKEKLAGIIHLLEQSKLKDCFTKMVETKKSVQLFYSPKATEQKIDEGKAKTAE